MKLNSIEYGLTDVLNVLRRNQQLPLLIKELALNEIIKDIELPDLNCDQLLSSFKVSNNLTSDDVFESFLNSNFLDEQLLINSLVRAEKISAFKKDKWGPRAQAIYLKSKEKYDLMTIHLLQGPSEHVMHEIYFRIKDNEDTWHGIAQKLSTPQSPINPILGPIPVAEVPFIVRKSLKEYGLKTITPPLYGHKEKTYYIAELIELSPSSLDDRLRQRIINEQYELWLNNYLKELISTIHF